MRALREKAVVRARRGWFGGVLWLCTGLGVQVSARVEVLRGQGFVAGAASQATLLAAPGGSVPADWVMPALAVGVLVLAVCALVVVGAGLGTLIVVRRERRRAASMAAASRERHQNDSSAAWMVDRALRVLLAVTERDGVRLPRVLGVFVEPTATRLIMASAAAPAAEPWSASDDGRSWSAPNVRLQREPISEASTSAFSSLVTLGVGVSGRALVDFSRARGVISLEGPTAIAREVVRRWLFELTSNPWSGAPRIAVVGDQVTGPDVIERLESWDELVPLLDGGGRGVAVLAVPPSAAQQTSLAARFSSAQFEWIVLVAGRTPSAKWRFTVDGEGTLRSEIFPDVQVMDRPTLIRR